MVWVCAIAMKCLVFVNEHQLSQHCWPVCKGGCLVRVMGILWTRLYFFDFRFSLHRDASLPVLGLTCRNT